jgi:hypothetical protein
MRDRREWDDRTRLDMNPMDEPVPAVQPVAEQAEERVVDSDTRRVRTVRIATGIVNLVCGLFAVVLGLHIVLVLLDANPNNGFASFVDSFAAAVSLGLRGLFTPDSAKLAVLFNDGLAAVVWLLIAGATNYAIRQFALPARRRRRYVIE